MGQGKKHIQTLKATFFHKNFLMEWFVSNFSYGFFIYTSEDYTPISFFLFFHIYIVSSDFIITFNINFFL